MCVRGVGGYVCEVGCGVYVGCVCVCGVCVWVWCGICVMWCVCVERLPEQGKGVCVCGVVCVWCGMCVMWYVCGVCVYVGCMCMLLYRVQLCAAPYTVACQAPLSMEFSR